MANLAFDYTVNYHDILLNVISPEKEMLAYEVLWALKGMTEKRMSRLFEKESLPTSVINIICYSEDIKKEDYYSKVEKYLSKINKKFSVCIHDDYQYPTSLQDAKYPIDLFYYRGELEIAHTRSVSVVGARECSKDGLARTKRLTRELVEKGYTIVSGLAKGVDTVALKTAMQEGGNVIAVIGTPINEYYPKENKLLQDTIAENYLLISQVPFYRYNHEPFQQRRHYFPRRNVTMSAISEATIIVEASDTSGTLTQARAALEQGRKLFILESCFQNKNITWPGNFLKKGAIRVSSTEEIYTELERNER